MDQLRYHGDGLGIYDIKVTLRRDLNGWLQKFIANNQTLYYTWFLHTYGDRFLRTVDYERLLAHGLVFTIIGLSLSYDIPKVQLGEPMRYKTEHIAEFDRFMRHVAVHKIKHLMNVPTEATLKEGLVYDTCNLAYCPFITACTIDENYLQVLDKKLYDPSTHGK
jgi:hypothetical protein